MHGSGDGGRARAPLASSVSSRENWQSPDRRARKRARRLDPPAASAAAASTVWRESRGANGQVVLSLDSDDDDVSDTDAATTKDGNGKADAETLPIKREAVAVTPTAVRRPPPVVYSVDSDSDEDEDDEDARIQETPSTLADGTEGHGESSGEDEEEEEEEEEEEDDDDDDDNDEEAEWEPEEDTEGHDTHASDEPDEEEDEDEEEEDEEDDFELIEVKPVAAPRVASGGTSVDDSVVKTEPAPTPAPVAPAVQTPVVTVPPAALVSAPPVLARVTSPELTAPAARTAVTHAPLVSSVFVNFEPPTAPLVSFSQLDHETPPARVRHPNRHPRAARRSVVRRHRLDDDHAGMLLFDGPQYVPPEPVVRTLIEFIARSIGPTTVTQRRWIDYVLLAKINTSIDRVSSEVMTRYSDWMKIALGASDEASQRKHQVQREPLLPLPIRYTVRPDQVFLLSPAALNGKSKAKSSTTAQKQRNGVTVTTKWLEKRATEIQSGEKRIKSETPRRRVVAVPPAGNEPFSPTSSTTSPVSSKARRALYADTPVPDRKRPRGGATPSPRSNGFHSPSTASTASAASARPSAAYLDLASEESTSGANRSMPKEWKADDAHAAPAALRPKPMNPLFTMSLGELRSHINSVRLDGRVRSFEKPLEIVQKIMSHPRNRYGTFNSPVDPVALNLPTYEEIIKKPMDLGMIKLRLEEGAYLEQDDFVADVRLVFQNAMTFNAPNHSVHVDASVLLKYFEELLRGDLHDRHLKRRMQQNPSERHACGACLGNTCAMCDQGCLTLAPPPFQCAGSCGVDIRKGSIYFMTRDGTRVWCAKCRVTHVRTASDKTQNGNDAQPDDPTKGAKSKKKQQRRGGAAPKKANAGIEMVDIPGELIKKKAEVDVEPWVKCARCYRWLHQVCGLYNPVFGAYTADNDYACPLCVWKQRSPNPPLMAATSSGLTSLLNEDSDLPEQKCQSSCNQIPTCELSEFIEGFLQRELRKLGESEAAESLHVRVLSFPHERVVVSDRLVKTFDENASIVGQACPSLQGGASQRRFPSEIAYTSRGIYLFQRHEGSDVCLFTLFVQEFDDQCQFEANRRSVYVAYLDSIRYLKPPSARTASYHFIMMAYFDYIRRHGFERVHIWSCPPQKRISYVFWCRPAFQKTPSAELLRSWYRNLLFKSQDAGIVKSWTTMYDRFFTAIDVSTVLPSNGGPSASGGVESGSTVATRGTALRQLDPKEHLWPTTQLPPLFEGDFIPTELERIFGTLAARNGKYRRGSVGGKSNSVGSTGGKLAMGEFVARIKEENGSAPTPVQTDFKLREVFDRCQHAVQRLKNDLLVVDLVVDPAVQQQPVARASVPTWWTQVPRFFGSRFMFHQLCSSATYQFDTLRRAKHSTMMLLHHFCNERVRQRNVFCSECYLLITHADFYHCPSCERFALCDLCHHRDGRSHAHELFFGGGLVQM